MTITIGYTPWDCQHAKNQPESCGITVVDEVTWSVPVGFRNWKTKKMKFKFIAFVGCRLSAIRVGERNAREFHGEQLTGVC